MLFDVGKQLEYLDNVIITSDLADRHRCSSAANSNLQFFLNSD
jgi:hypothetical protein